jgi:hypothetical protein
MKPRLEVMAPQSDAAIVFSTKSEERVWAAAVREKPYLRMRLPHLYESLAMTKHPQ